MFEQVGKGGFAKVYRARDALSRDVALKLNADARVGRYSVDVENFESIHNHSAYARIERA